MYQQVGNIINSRATKVNTNINKTSDKTKLSIDVTIVKIFSIINVIACISNLIILAFLFPRSQELEFDYAGIIVSILSILVTILVGWQIYTVLKIEKDVEKEFVQLYRQLSDEIKNKTECIKNSTLLVSLSQLGKTLYNNNNKQEAISTFFNALYFWNEDMTSDLEVESYNFSIQKLEEISMEHFSILVESEEEKEVYVKVAAKLNRPAISKLVLRIEVAKQNFKL